MLEDYHLKWNEFEKNTANSFAKLRNENSFYDVTLVSNDQKQVSAHKLILSACSDTFRTIFSNNNASNLVLYLDSLDLAEVNLILDYIYQGEVNVCQEQLDRFIQIAEKFQLDGLLSPTKDQNSPHVSIVKTESVDNQRDLKISNVASLVEKYKENEGFNQEETGTLVEDKADPTHTIVGEPSKETETYFDKIKTERDSDLEDIDYEDSFIIQEFKGVNQEETETLVEDKDDPTHTNVRETPKETETRERDSDIEDIDYEDSEDDTHDSINMTMNVKSEPIVPKIECSNAEFETKFQEMVVKQENFWSCTVCERTMKQRIDIKRHFENHLTGLSFDCTMCEKSFLTSQAHTAHRRKNHKAEIRKYHFKTIA